MSHGEREDCMFLFLPPDVLYEIFSHCDVQTLGRLSCVCRRLYAFLKQDCIWNRRSRHALGTNQLSSTIKNRSLHVLHPKEKCCFSAHWRKGWYIEDVLIQHYTAYMPWLQLESQCLWYSKGAAILQFPRMNSGGIAKTPTLTLRGHTDDVGRFVCKNGLVVSGSNDGTLCIWSANRGSFLHCKRRCHNRAINSVDFHDNIVVTGSRDKTVKVWAFQDHSSSCRYNVQMRDRVWAVAFSTCGRLIFTGSAGCNSVPPLQMYDVEMGTRLSTFGGNHRNGAGILQVYPESSTEILSCGYDTYVRLWDLRCPQVCVSAWEDPHDSTVYCVTSDHHVTIVSGTNRYGVVRLWDKRMLKPIQMYYVGRGNSPVYSVTFDPCYMYVALDRSLNVLSFTGSSWIPRCTDNGMDIF